MTDQLRKAKQYRWNPDVPLFDGPHLVMAEYWVHGGDLRDDDGGHPFSAAQGERRVVLATDYEAAYTALREAQERIAALETAREDALKEAEEVCHEVTKWGLGVAGALSDSDTTEWLSEECARRIAALKGGKDEA